MIYSILLPKIRGCRTLALAVLCCAWAALAVEWRNWRQPYYQIAAEMELVSSSPSTMFWDDLSSPPPPFDSALRQRSAAGNHWLFEPCLSGGMVAPRESDKHFFFGQLEALNDIRYRNLLIRQTLHADGRYDDDPFFPAHTGRFARGRVEEAYLQFDWRYGFARLGRLARNWGPFVDRSLVLSSNPYSYDALEWQVHSSLFEFRHLFAAFFPNENKCFSSTADNKPGRFFAAHTLNLMLGKWVTLGIVESIVFRRENGFPDLQYVNPFSVYTVSNTNQEGKGNLMLGFQWSVHPLIETVALRGQLMLDDFQVDNEIDTDKEPTHWGIDACLSWRDCLPLRARHLLKTGYQRRSEWIYTVSDNDMNWGEGYTYLSKGLGAPKNDGDSAWIGFSVIGNKPWVGSAAVSFAREGEKCVTSRWGDSVGNIPLPYDAALGRFPSGVVVKTISASLDIAAYLKRYADIRIGLVNRWIKNKDHRPGGGYVYSPMVTAELGVHFSGSVALPR